MLSAPQLLSEFLSNALLAGYLGTREEFSAHAGCALFRARILSSCSVSSLGAEDPQALAAHHLSYLGVVAGVPLVFVLSTVLFGLLLASGNPRTRSRSVWSADEQEAKLSYDGGFLGRDYTEVRLKRTGCCRHVVVFWHSGPSEFDDPKIEWLDNRHLRITYHTRRDDPQHCEQKMGDIAVACISSPWPDSPTVAQPQTGVSEKP
jgi:hypothetical protein